jgi:hypothetical protein
MVSARIRDFVPSLSGLHFANEWPRGTSYPVLTLPIVGTVVTQDAHNGLCGGFVLTALDCFLHAPRLLFRQQDRSRPNPGDPLFDYLVQRLIDSLLHPTVDYTGIEYTNASKCIDWIQTLSHDVSIGPPGLCSRMAFFEWPRIKADIDAGLPSPIFIVGGPWAGPGDIPSIIAALHNCHQVLAYAYSLDDAQNLTLRVYDCNDPFNDDSTISMNISNPHHTIDISAPGIIASLGGGVVIRGIFREDYSLREPTEIMGSLTVESPVLSWMPLLLGA